MTGRLDDEPALEYTVADIADELGMTEARVRTLVRSGELDSELRVRRRYISAQALTAFRTERMRRDEEAMSNAPTDWDWEGNLVKTLAEELERQGWREVSRARTALREHGIDLVVERYERTQVIEVKGWPSATHTRGPKRGQKKQWRSTVARNYMGDLVLSALLLRAERAADEVAIAVPAYETFTSLLSRIGPSIKSLGIDAYVIHEGGTVEQS